MRSLDFSSLHALLTTFLSLGIITLLGVGIRLVMQLTIQQRRERTNRQINERLRALIAAYKTLGGSFTGDLTVNPKHHRDLDLSAADNPGADRARRIRDAVESALSDIILLGTEDQVRLAAGAAHQLAEGKPVPTAELVMSLRNFIREALDLDPIPTDVTLPAQGPARPSAAGGKDKGEKAEGTKSTGGGGGMGGGSGMGGDGGMSGLGLSSSSHHDDQEDEADETNR